MKKEDLLKIARKIEKKDVPKPYNMFGELQLKENDHTKILLSLLRYRDAFGQYSVLNSFLNSFAKGRDRMIYYKHPTKVCIQFCPRLKDSFIDGLILLTVNKKCFAVILENKIFDAPDQKNQIRRYISYIVKEKKIAKDNVWVFYITGDGTKQVDTISYNVDEEEETTNVGHRFVPLTYSQDIIGWMKESILKNQIYPESVTCVVRQYVDYLEYDLFHFDTSNTKQQDMLSKELLGKRAVPAKMKAEDFEKVYAFRDEVIKLRREIRNECTQDCEHDINAVNNLYQVIREIIKNIEDDAFKRFEEMSAQVLNEEWKKELKSMKTFWRARRRGTSVNGGFIQIALTDEWETAHLEWKPISAKQFFLDTEYTLQLHVERNKPLAKKWQSHLKSNPVLLPPNSIIQNTSHMLSGKVETSKPIAKMKDSELKDFLKKLYTEEWNYLCRILVEEYKNYKVL